MEEADSGFDDSVEVSGVEGSPAIIALQEAVAVGRLEQVRCVLLY